MRVAAIVLAAAQAAAGTIDDGIPDSKYLKYAEGFSPYTARLEAGIGGGRVQMASAVLIADRWALTAAHVVHGTERVTVITGSTRHRIEEVLIHEDFDDTPGKFDIALLRSVDSFGLRSYPPLATRRHEVGGVVSIVGYGITGRLSGGHDLSDGRLRAGTNRIARYDGQMLVCDIRRGSSPLEICIAPGDSGGPVFCGGELVGVNSLTMRDKGPLKSREGEESGHTDVFGFLPWINEVMK
jgi:S1-C subfamily serine protease